MTYNIALNFEDGVTRFITCKPSETVVDASYRQGINIPMDCREGACSTCKCKVESGSYDLGEYVEDALSQTEADTGYALACQMRPKADCVVLISASSTVCKTKQEDYITTIRDVQALSESTFGLVLEGEGLKKLVFLPGQYANLQVPGEEKHRRAYSFSSVSPERDSVSFLIRNVPGGLMSGFLTQRAKPGGTITMAGPFGSFYLRPIQRPVLMLAGGTGLAPFLAMLEKIAGEGSGTHPIHLIYGVNTDRDIVGSDKLTALTQRIPNFTFAVCVVDPNSEQPRKGYVTHHIDAGNLNNGDVDIYLCGPPPMVEAVAQHLRDANMTSASFHFEKFAPSIS